MSDTDWQRQVINSNINYPDFAGKIFVFLEKASKIEQLLKRI